MMPYKSLSSLFAGALIALLTPAAATAEPFQVHLVEEVKISDFGMFFDGSPVPTNRGGYTDSGGTAGKYDFAFGSRITPHGDCIKVFGDYVFLTWYRGPESDRHVMLTRYNLKAGTQATIEFEHRHTGFQNNPNLGESHNTIAVGICEIDQTVHLLYDMHAYSPNKPDNGSLANDYFRYQYSLPGVASVPDEEFTLDKFKPKQLYLREGEDYESLTYPNFFKNADGELLVVMREGGNNNGKYQFTRYDGNEWDVWREFNALNAKSKGYDFNWGLYGDMKVFDGLLHIGFATRYSDNNDRYVYNNGTHYAYSTDPSGSASWFNAFDEPIDLPVINPDLIKVSEPGDVFDIQEKNSIRINSGVDWTKTPSGALHFVVGVKNDVSNVTENVHTYRGPEDTEFTISTDFPGGALHALGNYVYLIGLTNGHPRIHRALEGTDEWETVYNSNEGRTFRHGSVLIYGNQLFYYLMEQKSGSAQPIYLQIYQLAPDEDQPMLLRGEIDPDSQTVRLSWDSQSGYFYQVLTKDEVTDGTWIPVGDPIIGNGQALSTDVPLDTSDARQFWVTKRHQ